MITCISMWTLRLVHGGNEVAMRYASIRASISDGTDWLKDMARVSYDRDDTRYPSYQKETLQ